MLPRSAAWVKRFWARGRRVCIEYKNPIYIATTTITSKVFLFDVFCLVVIIRLFVKLCAEAVDIRVSNM